jgi:hypothetical protein
MGDPGRQLLLHQNEDSETGDPEDNPATLPPTRCASIGAGVGEHIKFEELRKECKADFEMLVREESRRAINKPDENSRGPPKLKRLQTDGQVEEEISFKTVVRRLKERFTDDKSGDVEFLQQFDQDGNGTIHFDEFLDIVVQVELRREEAVSAKRRKEFQAAMWQRQASRKKNDCTDAIQKVRLAFTEQPKHTVDEASKRKVERWEVDLGSEIDNLEKLWKVIDSRFFLRAIQVLRGQDRIDFLRHLVFPIEMKEDEDYLREGLGKPGITLPSQTPMSSANSVVMVTSPHGFPITRAREEEEIKFEDDQRNVFGIFDE